MSEPFFNSLPSRDLKKLEETEFDLLIIGGGINGAAVANMAQANGISVCLLEKNDFGSGTSSKSTKLIHGGIRYLENFDFHLVKEALLERAYLLEIAPNLVKPLEFIIPVYEGDKRPLWMMRFGTKLYDFFAGEKRIGLSSSLKVDEIDKIIKGIGREGLKGGVSYFDAQMDDARLVLDNILEAKKEGAKVLNYFAVKELIFENKKAVGVIGEDRLSKKIVQIKAKKILGCLGPWTNQFIEHDQIEQKKPIRMTKGVHFVYKETFSEKALLLPNESDGRIFFVIPFFGNSLIGTTDTNYIGDPSEVKVEDEDITYLIEGMKRVFPRFSFDKEKMICSFAGLRPLARKGGHPSKVSRKHEFVESSTGVVYITGGKYTTFRKVAEDYLEKYYSPEIIKNELLLYYASQTFDKRNPSLETNLTRCIYGDKLSKLEKWEEKYPELAEKICEGCLFKKSQIIHAIKEELTFSLEDLYYRRLPIFYLYGENEKIRESIKSLLSKSHSYQI